MNGCYGFPHGYSVHLHGRAGREILGSKLVLGWNIRFEHIGLRVNQNLLAFAEIGEGNYHVVAWVKFEDFICHMEKAQFGLTANPCGRQFPRAHCKTSRAIRRVVPIGRLAIARI